MEYQNYILMAIGVLVAFRIIKGIFHPPVPLDWGGVPEVLRVAFEASLPGFEVSEVIHTPKARSYRLSGIYRSDPVRARIEYNSAGDATEIECEAPGAGVRTIGPDCQLADLPPEVITHLAKLLGEERESFEPRRVQTGNRSGESGYEIKGSTPAWRWEFQLAASGQLIELEKKRL